MLYRQDLASPGISSSQLCQTSQSQVGPTMLTSARSLPPVPTIFPIIIICLHPKAHWATRAIFWMQRMSIGELGNLGTGWGCNAGTLTQRNQIMGSDTHTSCPSIKYIFTIVRTSCVRWRVTLPPHAMWSRRAALLFFICRDISSDKARRKNWETLESIRYISTLCELLLIIHKASYGKQHNRIVCWSLHFILLLWVAYCLLRINKIMRNPLFLNCRRKLSWCSILECWRVSESQVYL